MLSSLKRPSGASSVATAACFALGTGLLLTLSSCGDSDGSAQSATTVTIQPTSYVIREQVTTTTTPVQNSADTAGRSQVEQAYTVESGDYPVKVATLYDVDLDELSNFNQWEADYSDFPSVGGTVRIPPGAKFVNPNAPETTDEARPKTRRRTAARTTRARRARPSAVRAIRARTRWRRATIPGGVAEKFDVTVEALNEANAATEGYSAFYVGLDIVIPPPSDCE